MSSTRESLFYQLELSISPQVLCPSWESRRRGKRSSVFPASLLSSSFYFFLFFFFLLPLSFTSLSRPIVFNCFIQSSSPLAHHHHPSLTFALSLASVTNHSSPHLWSSCTKRHPLLFCSSVTGISPSLWETGYVDIPYASTIQQYYRRMLRRRFLYLLPNPYPAWMGDFHSSFAPP